METEALRPIESATSIRGRFAFASGAQLHDVLNSLSSKSTIDLSVLANSYVEQKGCCKICGQPMSIRPVPISPTQLCGDWCIDLIPHSTSLAHVLCCNGLKSADLEQYEAESKWLHSLQKRILEGNQKDHHDGTVDGLIDRYMELILAVKSILRVANDPPHSFSSRWRDASKNMLLEKRCHKTQCCDKWNPASIMPIRREIKPGQIDSNDYFECFCPASFVVAKQAITMEVLVKAAHETYALHERLLPLLVASNNMGGAVLPRAAPLNSELQQWSDQKSLCAICTKEIDDIDCLRWDVCGGKWKWMHIDCNKNIWARYMSTKPIPILHKREQLYQIRHTNDQLFDETLNRVRRNGDVELKLEMLEALRQRSANLVEQAVIQTRHSHQLRFALEPWIAELIKIDPTARLPTDTILQPELKRRKIV